jgi:hypothetical protein
MMGVDVRFALTVSDFELVGQKNVANRLIARHERRRSDERQAARASPRRTRFAHVYDHSRRDA